MNTAVIQALLLGSARMLDKATYELARNARAWLEVKATDKPLTRQKILELRHKRGLYATYGILKYVLMLAVGVMLPTWYPTLMVLGFGLVWILGLAPPMLRKHTRAQLRNRTAKAAKLDKATRSGKALPRMRYTGWLGTELEHITRLRLRPGADFPMGKEGACNELDSHMRELLGKDHHGAERQIEVDWNKTRGYVDIDCAPEIPAFYRLTREDIERYTDTDRQILIGMGNGNKPVVVDFAKVAHLLAASPTGAGKSTFTRTVAANLFHHIEKAVEQERKPWRLVGLDPKRLGLRFMSGRPGTHWVATDYDDMCAAVGWIHGEMEAWYEQAEYADILPELLRIFLFNEELAALGFMEELEADGNKPIIKQLANLARKGREAGVHMLSIIQQAAAIYIPTEMRGNHEGRLGMTKLPREASQMLYNDAQIGMKIPAIPGRGLIDLQGERDWVQLAWTPNPDALDLSLEERGLDPKEELRTGKALFPAKNLKRAQEERVHAASATFGGPESY